MGITCLVIDTIEIQSDITSSSLICLISTFSLIVFLTLLETKDSPIKINEIKKNIPPEDCQRMLCEFFSTVEVGGGKIMEALYLR